MIPSDSFQPQKVGEIQTQSHSVVTGGVSHSKQRDYPSRFLSKQFATHTKNPNSWRIAATNRHRTWFSQYWAFVRTHVDAAHASAISRQKPSRTRSEPCRPVPVASIQPATTPNYWSLESLRLAPKQRSIIYSVVP